MAYCNNTQILMLVPKLANTLTVTKVIDAHITRADAVINSMISKRYALPFTDTPPMIAQISEDISTYFVYRSFYSQDNQNRFEYFQELKETAINNLEKIRNGEIDLVDSTGDVIAEKTTVGNTMLTSNTEDYQSYFDYDDCLSWKWDEDLLAAIDRGN